MNLHDKRFLVTGGTGFIGSALVRGLLAAGAKVRSFDDNSRGSRHRLDDLDGDLELVTGDIRRAADVSEAVRGVDSVCHLAYVNGTEFFYSKPELVLEVAVKGMMNVLDACLEHGVRELVLASSSEVYQTPPTVPTDEHAPLSVPDPLNPRYSYGGGKIIAELLALNYGRKHFDRVLVFRPHNVYGPDMGREHVIPQLVQRLLDRTRNTEGAVDLPIQGSGKETRSFVFISDLVDGVLRMIAKGEHQNIYHIGSDLEVSIDTLVHEIGRCLGREVRPQPGQLQPGGTPRRCPDITKIRTLGYEPRVSLADGLAETIRWYADHPAQRESADV